MVLRSAISMVLASLVIWGANAAVAAPHTAGHANVKPSVSKQKSPSTRAYIASMEAMHKAMHVPLSGDADIDFVRQMIPHHEGALTMARIQLKYGKNEKLKCFSRWIIRAQELEIAKMNNWLERRDNGKKLANAQDYYGPAMTTMHHAMMIDYTGDADIDFMRGMIAHHQGALDMASIWFEHGDDPDLNLLIRDIYTSQSGEIAIMRRWLTAATNTH